jgi:hypothetical protein
MSFLAPQVGFEPTTLRLTAECSTVELLRSISLRVALLGPQADAKWATPIKAY